jgi:hypothetical protein
MIDKSLSFGQQNFFYVNQYENVVSGDDNTYVLYMDRKGEILIARFSADGNEGRYFVTKGDYATVVAELTTYTYVLPNEVVDQSMTDL